MATILERIRELQSYAREATATSDIEQIGEVLEELIKVVEKLILASGTSKMSEPNLNIPRLPPRDGSKQYQQGYEEGYRKAIQDSQIDIDRLRARVAELEAAWTKENNVAGKFEGELQVAEAHVAELETAAMDALCVLDGIADGDFKPDGTAISGAMVRLRAVLAKERAA